MSSSRTVPPGKPAREHAWSGWGEARLSILGSGSGNPANFAPATFRTPDDAAGGVDGSLWLSYLSGNHTGADVPIYAVGPRSAGFDQTIDNTDIFRLMRSVLKGLR